MRTLNDYFLTGKITTISTAGSSFVTAPDSGKIIKIYTTIKNAISSADAGLSFEIGGVAVGGGGITVTQSGSAAGDVDSATPSARPSCQAPARANQPLSARSRLARRSRS